MMMHGTTDIRRFLERGLVFLALFVAVYLLTIFAAVNLVEGGIPGLGYTNVPLEAPTVGGPSSYTFAELGDVGELDILWLGSSHAYRTFDPRFFDRHGLRTFNLGTTAQTPLNTYFLLREHLDRLRPRVMVVEIYWVALGWDGIESTLDLIANAPPSTTFLQMAAATRDVRPVNAWLRRTVDLRRPPVSSWQPNLWQGDTYIGRGFVEKAPEFQAAGEWLPGKLTLRSSQLRYLERIVDLARERNIPTLLVVQPLPPRTLAGISNREEIDASLRRFAARHDIPYVDFNGFMQLDRERHFFDPHHLNQAGLAEFLPELHARLVAMGLVGAGATP